MELCKARPAQVQMEEYVIHVAEATDLYTNLRFSLLGSSWLPRPVGACLWSLLRIILVLCFSIMLLALFLFLSLLAVSVDAFVLMFGVIFVIFGVLVGVLVAILAEVIASVINCGIRPGAPMPCVRHGRPGHSVAQEGAARAKVPGPLDIILKFIGDIITLPPQTVRFYKYVMGVSFPYWRERLVSLYREIVPSYDAIVI